MKTKLKPCPFCGNTNIVFIGPDSGTKWYYCSNCAVIGPEGESKSQATRLWNKRVKEIEP